MWTDAQRDGRSAEYRWRGANEERKFLIPSLVTRRLSVWLSSVTFVRLTQAVQIFRNISMALGTLAIHWHPLKISRISSWRNPSARVSCS